jgi:hypothetical protein
VRLPKRRGNAGRFLVSPPVSIPKPSGLTRALNLVVPPYHRTKGWTRSGSSSLLIDPRYARETLAGLQSALRSVYQSLLVRRAELACSFASQNQRLKLRRLLKPSHQHQTLPSRVLRNPCHLRPTSESTLYLPKSKQFRRPLAKPSAPVGMLCSRRRITYYSGWMTFT